MKREQWTSTLSLVAMVLVMPLLLKALNKFQRVLVGAEGRLAAITVDVDHPLGPMPKPWQALAQGGEALKDFLDTTGPQVAAILPKLIRVDHIYDGFNV